MKIEFSSSVFGFFPNDGHSHGEGILAPEVKGARNASAGKIVMRRLSRSGSLLCNSKNISSALFLMR